MENYKKEIIKIFWVFIIGCIVGFIAETMVGLIVDGRLECRQGLIYGPFTPVYGIGALMYYFTVPRIKNIGLVFLFSMVLGGIAEYACSFFQEQFFGTISWDYSDMWFNINGRTSLFHCFCWGILGIAFVKLVYPMISELDSLMDKKTFIIVTIILMIFMFFNISISCLAGERQDERMRNIPPQTKLDVFLDTHYPDKLLNRVYFNKIHKI